MFVGIPYVNRLDLLTRAIACVPPSIRIRLQVNSDDFPAVDSLRHNMSAGPRKRLSYAQSMVEFQWHAEGTGCPYWLNMHSDGLARHDDFHRLVDRAKELNLEDRKWAAIFTNHDVLVCFNTRAIRAIGGWDTTFINYFFDNHNYRRLTLAGWEMVQLEDHTVEHGVDGVGSQTINSDPVLKRTNGILFPAYQQLYQEMWGGMPGKEKFLTPWNQ